MTTNEIVFFLFLIMVACNKNLHDEIALNKRLPKDAKIIKSIYVEDYANGINCIQIKKNNITYSVFLEDSIVKIIFIFDTKFKTPDGGIIGNNYASIKNSVVKSEYIQGYVYEVTLKSGWVANFSDNSIFTTGSLSDTSVIKYFTMRSE